jgi:hypothetical protein
MPNMYEYELWNGKKVVGYHLSLFPLIGRKLVIYETNVFKEKYANASKTFTVPITFRVVYITQTECLTRIILDVRRKSKRQIEIIIGASKQTELV